MQHLLRLTAGLTSPTAFSRVRVLAALMLSLWLGVARPAQAQVDTYQFAASQGTYTPLVGGTALPDMLADTYITPTAIPLGFTFVFDGAPFTAVKASSNGFLTFNATGSSSISTLAAAVAANRPLVAPLGDDLDGRPVGATAQASYLTTGTAPNRVFTFEWQNWEWRWGVNLAVISFQVKLYEGSNRVEFIYQQEPNPTNATATLGASIGLAGTGTGSGSYLALSDATANPTASSTTENTNINTKPATGQVYAFTPAAPAACPAPRNLAATATSTTANLTWTVTGGGGTFRIEYGPQGFTPGSTAGTVVTSTTTSASLTGLTATTPYDFYVTQICGGSNGNSLVAGPATFTTLANPPANDACTAAVSLTPGAISAACPGATSGTLLGATPTAGLATPVGTADDDVWYSFVATSRAHTVTLTGSGDYVQELLSGSCGALTTVAFSDPNVKIYSGLTVGATYYLRVYSYSATLPSATAAPFTICVTTPTPPPVNDDPSGAIALTVNATCTPVTGNNEEATTTTPNGYANPGTSPNSCGIAVSPSDVWFTFTTPATGVASTAVRVLVTGVPASQLRAFSAASAAGPFTQIGCSSTSATVAAPPLDLTQLTPNTTYYVRVSGYGTGNPEGAFTICVTFPPTCGDPRTLTFTNTTQTATQVNFVPGNGQQTFTVTATPTAGGTAVTATGTASPIQLTGLTAGTPYTVTVVGLCPDGSSTATLTGTVSTLIINDDPSGAVQLTLGSDCLTPTSATLVGATSTTPSGYTNPGTACTPSTATAPRDVWFKFTTAAAGVGSTEVTLTTTGNNANVLRVFSAASSAGPFSDVACKSSTGSTVTAGSLIVTGLTPNTTYYVSVAGYTNTTVQSAFTICVRGNSNCPLPVGLTTGATTATTASLTWNVAGTTPSGTFVIEYGPQGFTPGTGAGTTVTSTTPSVTLTGLTSDTQYCYYVSQNCGTLNGSSERVGPVCFRTDIAPANNDDPCTATVLTVNATATNATTLGATTTLPNGYANPGCTTAGSPRDVWFSFVHTSALSSGGIVVGGNTAGQVRLFSAATCSGPFTQLACQAGPGANTQAPALPLSGLTVGTTYYVSVSGFASNDAQGPFTIQLRPVLSTGKGELPGGEVSVFPNPSHNGTLNLAIRGAGAVKTAQALLFNSLGQQVLTKTVVVRAGAVQQALPVQGLAKGLYTLRVQVGEHTITRKVVLD
ncbi:fibronectin type III domain-containing protein [Microvirga sp. STR05]|uniref:Fibronectin type III domain-containing protein n=1 Tax=Hymenobacter duratus TaxID=2771356 RepID=A0ABR8JD08_9BACT|nr:fibronectin type III domain-containing protein [Hymenobacter duratus]MBD2713615.1 fibronectin type III domain-containing protein [Hymenobacter duratus]MBR7948517.1 fibronectin type III domain-containing protein [Microvirga sp. STR05]